MDVFVRERRQNRPPLPFDVLDSVLRDLRDNGSPVHVDRDHHRHPGFRELVLVPLPSHVSTKLAQVLTQRLQFAIERPAEQGVDQIREQPVQLTDIRCEAAPDAGERQQTTDRVVVADARPKPTSE